MEDDGVSENFELRAEKELIVSEVYDSFYQKNMYLNLGELAENVKNYIQEVSVSDNFRFPTLKEMFKLKTLNRCRMLCLKCRSLICSQKT